MRILKQLLSEELKNSIIILVGQVALELGAYWSNYILHILIHKLKKSIS